MLDSNRIFIEFEEPIEKLYQQIKDIELIGAQQGIDVTKIKAELEEKLLNTQKSLFKSLTPWQIVQLSRHPNRPYTNYYINEICKEYTELHGDRTFGDDKAIVGGFGLIDDKTYMLIGHQKGSNTKARQFRNFGMPNPEGYRKALRLMKLAEKFNKPIVCFLDTPGAYPGLEAEERGQAEAIARNIYEMIQLKVPVLCIIIGEGASGGALGIGVGDTLLMCEYSWYSVISPESCSSILWRSWEHKEKAASALKLTATDLKKLNLIDTIIKEPLGGAHNKPNEMAKIIKKAIKKNIKELSDLSSKERIESRIKKYEAIGTYTKQQQTKVTTKAVDENLEVKENIKQD